MRIEPAIPFDLEAPLMDRVYHPIGVWQEAPEADGLALSAQRIHRRIGRGSGLLPPRAAESASRRKRLGTPIDRAMRLGDSMEDRRTAQRWRALGVDRPGGGDGTGEGEHAGPDRVFEGRADRLAHRNELDGRRGGRHSMSPAHHVVPGRRNAAMSSINASARAIRPFIWRKAWIMPS